METIIVCQECGQDHLGMCSDAEERRGFDAHCFECNRSVVIREIPLTPESDSES